MRIRRISLQDFRNITTTTLELRGRQTFLLGPNGQGKTNLLEAVGCLTALRSFRSPDNRLLVRQGAKSAVVGVDVTHDSEGDAQIVYTLKPGGREVRTDGEKVTRFADYIGRFPTVVFSSQDQQLVRGAPGDRRRWVDLTLSAMDRPYFQALQQYHRALADRNALLKKGGATAELVAFEQPMAAAAAKLRQGREAGTARLAGVLREAYHRLAEHEDVDLVHRPSGSAETVAAWLEHWSSQRERERIMGATLSGPHRDEWEFRVLGRAARDYGSEGQQRSLVLALRLAQMDYFHACRGVRPVLLADDVLGELDPERRRRFWSAIGDETQVIATGTQPPDASLGAWQIFDVAGGTFAQRDETKL